MDLSIAIFADLRACIAADFRHTKREAVRLPLGPEREPGVAGCIDLCCAAEYEALLYSGGFDSHGGYFFVPGLLCKFTLARAYAALRAESAWQQIIEDSGHADAPTMRAQVLARLDRLA